MKKFYILLVLAALSYGMLQAQVGIGTTSPEMGSILELKGNGSLLLPRVMLIDPNSKMPVIDAIRTENPTEGMLVYNMNDDLTQMPDGKGVYFWSENLQWEKLKFGSATPLSIWYKTGTSTLANSTTDKIFRSAEVTLGNNVDMAGALLNLEADDKGLLLPRVNLVSATSTEPLIIPNTPTALSQGMFVYNVGNAALNEGVYYWDGRKWNILYSGSTVLPMNALFNDNDTFPADGITSTPALVLANVPNLYLVQCDYTSASDYTIINNPIPGFQFLTDTRGERIKNSETLTDIVNDTTPDGMVDLINFPNQILDHAVTISLSLKYKQTNSNSDNARIVAYGSADGINYNIKVKDAFYKLSKNSTQFDFVRDELSLTNIIVTQDIVNYGLRLYIGNANSGALTFYEPVITLNYGMVTI